jgi:hypothetical protein
MSIFVSYRRNDVPDMVGRIYDNLKADFRKHEIFKDVDSIRIGSDFRTVLKQALESCQIVLVAIGPNWLTSKDEHGRLRLEDPNDFVRLELEAAFERGVTVIPILVAGVEIPPPSVLPETLRPLCYLQALPIRRDPDFTADVFKLKREISRIVSSGQHRRVALNGTLIAVVALLAIAISVFSGSWTPSQKDAAIPEEKGCREIPFTDRSKSPPVISTVMECSKDAACREIPFTDRSKSPPVVTKVMECD